MRVSFISRDFGGAPGRSLDAKLADSKRVLAQRRRSRRVIREVEVKVEVVKDKRSAAGGRRRVRLRGSHRSRLALEFTHVGHWNRRRVRVRIGELFELDQVEGRELIHRELRAVNVFRDEHLVDSDSGFDEAVVADGDVDVPELGRGDVLVRLQYLR